MLKKLLVKSTYTGKKIDQAIVFPLVLIGVLLTVLRSVRGRGSDWLTNSPTLLD